MSDRTAEISRTTNIVSNVMVLSPSLYVLFESVFTDKYYVLSEIACIGDVYGPETGIFRGVPGTPNGPSIDLPETG
jgi:hypothetical protein